jgi:hypothetical protein
MLTDKDNQLLTRILEACRAGKIDWAPSGEYGGYVTSLSGKYVIKVKQNQFAGSTCWLTIDSEDGGSVVSLTSNDFEGIAEIYELARRRALKVDETIDEIIKDLDSQG